MVPPRLHLLSATSFPECQRLRPQTDPFLFLPAVETGPQGPRGRRLGCADWVYWPGPLNPLLAQVHRLRSAPRIGIVPKTTRVIFLLKANNLPLSPILTPKEGPLLSTLIPSWPLTSSLLLCSPQQRSLTEKALRRAGCPVSCSRGFPHLLLITPASEGNVECSYLQSSEKTPSGPVTHHDPCHCR